MRSDEKSKMNNHVPYFSVIIPTLNEETRIERLLNRLERRVDFILLRYGHIPEVEEKCEEVLDTINSDGWRENLCDTLFNIINFIDD